MCVGVWLILCFLFVTLAGEAVDVEVCVLDSHHLAAANLAAALAHNGRAPTAGERRAAVVVSAIKTWLVLNWRWGGGEGEGETGGEETSKTCDLLSSSVPFSSTELNQQRSNGGCETSVSSREEARRLIHCLVTET